MHENWGPSSTITEGAHGINTSESPLASCPQLFVSSKLSIQPRVAQQGDAGTHRKTKDPPVAE